MRKSVIAALALCLLPLAGCGGSPTPPAAEAPRPAATDVEQALATGATLTFWSWVPGIEKAVDLFRSKYPKVTVNLVNAGQSAAQYTKLQSAVKAGSGAPDVAQIEYFALPQFALSKAVVDLNPYGAASWKGLFTESAWAQVNVNGGVYGVPQDTGPMAMFYRKDLLDRAGVKPPATWDEFVTAAQKLKKANPSSFITTIDPGDAGGVDSLIWQAGGRPFAITGPSGVRVDLQDAGAKRWAALWTRLLKDELVDPAAGWNDAWWQGMSGGKYAMWLTGAWAPGAIESTIPQTKGRWRVAPMPRWDAGTPVNAENGGSSVAVLAQSENTLAAAGFAKWLNSDPEAVRMLNTASGLFPATGELLNSPEFTDAEMPFFDGQRANEILARGSAEVAAGWNYLPFQVYANSVIKDTVGQALAGRSDIAAGLSAWQQQITGYAKQQGFTVTTGP
ncbi:ABC transporter substrate-binding protein [Sphaerisporangium aureirubrum]|uniref:ABC transporter substrate-binding protein n=1 Tax=Sphaerisporangium aureirubrum TaxID=1544736 RepID=A0ABW1NHC6_9ACTN